MKTFKKILTLTLILVGIFVCFKLATPVMAQYGFQKLMGVRGLETASVGEIIVRVISWVMAIIGLICVVFIIYGGVMYATSGGSEEHITRGKKILLWAIVGLIISILAFVIANAVVGAIGGGTPGAGACIADFKGDWWTTDPLPDHTKCNGVLDARDPSGDIRQYCWCGTYMGTGSKIYCSRQCSNYNDCRSWCDTFRQYYGQQGAYACDCEGCR